MTDTSTKINLPFALKGDKTLPPDTDNQGRVNFTQGYTGDYELDLNAGDVNAKAVERKVFNGLFNLITENLMQWQQHAFPLWYQDNGTGYAAGAFVSVTNTAGEYILYRSLVDDNVSDPQTDQLNQWEVVLSQTELLAKVAFLRGGGDLNQLVDTTGTVDLNTIADGFYFFENGAVNKPSDVGVRFYLMTIKTSSTLGIQLLIDDNFHLYGRYFNEKTVYPWLRYDRELLKTYNNLSDLGDKDAARTNLDLEDLYLGGIKTFDKTVSDAKGGYPTGVILQSSDATKPWVLWQNTVDKNQFDPNQNDITSSATQNGWVRYPVVEAKDGAMLYYSDEGKLAVFTAQNTSVKYVSWSTGNDTTGDGTRKNPFKTIDKAIKMSPSSGQIIIKVLDKDDHYVVGMNDAVTKDPSQYTPGPVYTASDNITQEPPETLSYNVSIGIRNVVIEPYNNPDGKTDGPDGWEELIALAQANAGDSWWGYCVDDDALTSRGLRRPVLYKLWCYQYVCSNGKWITSSLRYCGFDGIEGSFSVSFAACRLVNYNLDALNNAAFSMAVGFERDGGSYIYNGCIIDLLCTPSAYNKYSMGGTSITTSNLSFQRINYFVNEQQNTAGLFIGVNSTMTLMATADRSGTLPFTNYNYITSNVCGFLSKSSSYTAGTLTQIAKPSPHYAYLNTNILIT